MLRLCAALESTETFKQKKQQLIRDGFDPDVVADPLYLRDPRSGVYGRLDHGLYARLVDGSLRL